MLAILRRAVVVALLAAWSFPATGLAKGNNESSEPAAPAAAQTLTSTPGGASSAVAQYSAREKQAQGLENFQGGEGTYIYIGGGALTVVLIVLLILVIL